MLPRSPFRVPAPTPPLGPRETNGPETSLSFSGSNSTRRGCPLEVVEVGQPLLPVLVPSRSSTGIAPGGGGSLTTSEPALGPGLGIRKGVTGSSHLLHFRAVSISGDVTPGACLCDTSSDSKHNHRPFKMPRLGLPVTLNSDGVSHAVYSELRLGEGRPPERGDL